MLVLQYSVVKILAMESSYIPAHAVQYLNTSEAMQSSSR